MDRRTYPVWVDSETAIRLLNTRSVNQVHLAMEHGREGEPAITIVGSVEQVHRLVVEADRQLSRLRLDRDRSSR